MFMWLHVAKPRDHLIIFWKAVYFKFRVIPKDAPHPELQIIESYCHALILKTLQVKTISTHPALPLMSNLKNI